MSLSKESKHRERQSQSVYQSSDIEPDRQVPTQSVAGSELVGDIATLSLQSCEACQRTDVPASKNAKWFCRECEELLCDECKTFHKKFKISAGHNVVSLHVPCSLCTAKNITSTALYYCRECEDFLCTECKSLHQQFKSMKDHTLISSRDKIREKDNTPTIEPSTPAQQTTDDAKHSVAPSKKSLSSKKVSLSNKKVKYVNKVKVRLADDQGIPLISSSVFLSDSDLLLVDRKNKKLKRFNSDFELIQVHHFRNNPRNIAVNGKEVVISTSGSSIIKLYVAAAIEEKGIINVQFDCWGIDFIDKDRLAVAGRNPDIFCVYNMDGTELFRTDKVGTFLFCEPWYVTVDRETQRIYVSNFGSDTVVAFDVRRDNAVLPIYRVRDIHSAGMVAIDGCIITCDCRYWGSVYQISEEGPNNKLLSGKFLRTISFSPSGDCLIVGGGNPGNDAGKYIHVYKLK